MKDNNLIFIEYVSDCLEKMPNLHYEWRNNNTEVVLNKNHDEGFDVIIGHQKDILYLNTDRGFHGHFEAYEDFSIMIVHVMGLARDLLRKNLRIREISTNAKPGKWILERYQNGAWKMESLSGLFLWNYFGKKTERSFVNDVLPAREL
jgi:hypothetical protein